MVEPNDGQIVDDSDGLTALGALSARCTDSPAAVVRISTLKHITPIVPSAHSSHALTPILPWRARRVLVDSTGQLRWLQSPRTTGASRCTADTLWCAPYTLTQHVTRFARSALRGCAMPPAKRSSALACSQQMSRLTCAGHDFSDDLRAITDASTLELSACSRG